MSSWKKVLRRRVARAAAAVVATVVGAAVVASDVVAAVAVVVVHLRRQLSQLHFRHPCRHQLRLQCRLKKPEKARLAHCSKWKMRIIPRMLYPLRPRKKPRNTSERCTSICRTRIKWKEASWKETQY